MDLFVVLTIGFHLLYAFVIVRLGRRDLVWINVTANLTAEWVARQITSGSTNRCEQVARHPGRTSSNAFQLCETFSALKITCVSVILWIWACGDLKPGQKPCHNSPNTERSRDYLVLKGARAVNSLPAHR